VSRDRVRFQYEWHNDSGQMHRREASINDVPIAESDRKFFWPAPGPRPAGHPGIPDVA
jgi:nuclear transport factor 2 (NTF2) superfamily protein